jgi:predicted  nucleic acid-binding Zn-ribbon protein
VDIAFDRLIHLQNVDSEIAGLASLLDAVPARLEAIDKKIQATTDVVLRAKEKLAANQKHRRDLEGEIKSIRETVAKYKRQQNEVKSNKEYEAIKKEISETQEKIDGIEETILNEMIAADDVEKEIKAAQAAQVSQEVELKAEKKTVAAEQADLEARKAAAQAERAALLPTIPAEQVKLYNRIHVKKGGVAMSEVTDDFCSLCQMRVRPQLLDELIGRKAVITCEACGRILYWAKASGETPPTTEAAPAGTPVRSEP